jgi:hypothetical protein
VAVRHRRSWQLRGPAGQRRQEEAFLSTRLELRDGCQWDDNRVAKWPCRQAAAAHGWLARLGVPPAQADCATELAQQLQERCATLLAEGDDLRDELDALQRQHQVLQVSAAAAGEDKQAADERAEAAQAQLAAALERTAALEALHLETQEALVAAGSACGDVRDVLVATVQL